MNRNEFDAWDQRIRARADVLWSNAGRPEGGPDRFVENARELVAIEEVPPATFDPFAPRVIEEASLQRNLGEFPTLVDQGEEQTFPDRADNDGEIHLSDGDASDDGGVLPVEDDVAIDLPEVSQGDADITVSAVSASDVEASVPDDLNDDGLADRPVADDEDA